MVLDGTVSVAVIHPVCPFGRPGRRTRIHEIPAVLARSSTGRTVRTCVSGRRAATVWMRCACELGFDRATWLFISTTSGWLAGTVAPAAGWGATRAQPRAAVISVSPSAVCAGACWAVVMAVTR